MAGFSLELPTIQNWSCHSCSGCCRQHAILITAEERDRIAGQNWTAEDGLPRSQPLFARVGSWFSRRRRRWRLAHQPDGRCVFLDEQGLCRIHAKFGEAAKPLACRIYPYAFHPKGKQVVVSLRFSCPSVVRNQGQPVREQQRDLRDLARLVVPESVTRSPPPRLTDRQRLDWPDVLRITSALEETLQTAGPPFPVRLLRALQWLGLIEQARLDSISGERLSELLELLSDAADAEIPDDIDFAAFPRPGRLAGILFRLHAGQYARIDYETANAGRMRERWRRLHAAVRLVRGSGRLPELHERLPAIDFACLETPMGVAESAVADLFARYFEVKLTGMSFCGPAYYGVPLVEGFRSLALVYPVVLWIARWIAASEARTILTENDLGDALAIADHHHGYSPALGTFAARSRVRTLQNLGEIPNLIAWYSRGQSG